VAVGVAVVVGTTVGSAPVEESFEPQAERRSAVAAAATTARFW
jgi:hypothetical protein